MDARFRGSDEVGVSRHLWRHLSRPPFASCLIIFSTTYSFPFTQILAPRVVGLEVRRLTAVVPETGRRCFVILNQNRKTVRSSIVRERPQIG
jgi:hypothetical protein